MTLNDIVAYVVTLSKLRVITSFKFFSPNPLTARGHREQVTGRRFSSGLL
jgi:hypothetical protein